MDIPHILDNGKDIAFYCARLEGKTTLTACRNFAHGIAVVIPQVWQMMNWQAMKEAKKQVMGLKNLSEKLTARTMPNL